MRILIANHHLNERAGSELYCLELATALKEAGQQVAIFTLLPGEVAQQLRGLGVPVFTPEDRAAIEAFDPEVLHVQHAPCLFFLAGLKLSPVTVFSSLGVLPALEAAPPVFAGVALGFAISEEARAALLASPFGAAVPIEVVRNWFDDRGLQPGRARPGPARRIAVVTNHLAPSLRVQLDALCASEPGLEWVHFGHPENPVKVDAALLLQFDRVITVGRTALLAAALGIPCLLLDVHGCDGLITPQRLDAQATVNFSGRLERGQPSAQQLRELLLERAVEVDTAAVSERLWADYRLTGRVTQLLAAYQRAADRGVRLDAGARPAYGRLGEVYAEALKEGPALRGQLLEVEGYVGKLLGEITGLKAALSVQGQIQNAAELAASNALRERNQVHSQLQQTRAELQQTQERLAVVGQQLEASGLERTELRATLEAVNAQLQGIEQSLAWNAVGRLRQAKDTLVPRGSASRRAMDLALQRLRRALNTPR